MIDDSIYLLQIFQLHLTKRYIVHIPCLYGVHVYMMVHVCSLVLYTSFYSVQDEGVF